jgi:hypothetical protein
MNRTPKTKDDAGPVLGGSPCSTDYAYASIEEFEEIVGYKVNDAFKDGWRMARTTNAMLGILSNAGITDPHRERVSPTQKGNKQ